MEVKDAVSTSAEARICPKDYVDDATFLHILALIAKNTRRAADKAEEWKRKAIP
jgi:hypothetical protein